MTEEEGDLLHNVSNQYWYDFSELVNLTLLSVPAHLRNFLEEKMQESSSVYGRNDVQTYHKEAPHPYTLTRGPCRSVQGRSMLVFITNTKAQSNRSQPLHTPWHGVGTGRSE
jgi:hypothetical protein